jgi:O-antigen/teichoic acid export membrane protein
MGTNVAVAGVTLMTSLILARAMGPEGRGVLANAVLWPTVLSHLAVMGVPLYLSRIVAQQNSEAANWYRHGYVVLAVTAAIATTFWMAIDILTPSWPSAAGGMKLSSKTPFIALGATIIPFSMWNAFQIQMELGRGSIATYNFARMSFAFLYLASIALLWLTAQTAPVGYLAAFTFAAVVGSLASHLLISFRLKRNQVGLVNDRTSSGERVSHTLRQPILETLKRAWPFAISTAALAIMTMADRMLISLFFDAHTMGIYVVAIAMAQVQPVINESIAPLFFRLVAQHSSLGTIDVDLLAKRLRQSVGLNGLIAIGLLVIAPILLPLVFGRTFSDAVPIVWILVPAVAFRSMMRSFEEVLKARNKPLSQAAAMTIMLAVFAIGGPIAAYFKSTEGVALAYVASSFAGFAFVTTAVAKHLKQEAIAVLIPLPSDFAGLASEIRRILPR